MQPDYGMGIDNSKQTPEAIVDGILMAIEKNLVCLMI